MGVRENEIERLIKYAEGMGVKVKFNRFKMDSAAEWAIDGTEITVFTRANTSRTDTILSLIHEIGHHVWFIHEKDRQPDLKFDEAITRENLFADNLTDRPTPKRLRKKILAAEVAATKYWETIWKDTNIRLPRWKLFASMEFDMWMYEQYAETGHFPKGETKRKHRIAVNMKHKAIKYE